MKNKTLLIVLFVAVIIFALLTPVKATISTYGTVTTRANEGNGTVTNASDGTVTVTFDKSNVESLKWVANDQDDIERPANGWWLGFKLTKPTGATEEELKETTMSQDHKFASERSWSGKIFADNVDKDDNSAVSFFTYIDDAILEGKTSEFVLAEYTINWPGKGAQKIIVKVDATGGIELKKDGSVAVTVKDTVDTERELNFTIKEGSSFNESLTDEEFAKLNAFKEKTGYKFNGLYTEANGEKVFNLDDKLSADTTIYALFTKNPTNTPATDPKDDETADENVLDDTSKTGVVATGVIASAAIAVVSLAGIAVSKKTRK